MVFRPYSALVGLRVRDRRGAATTYYTRLPNYKVVLHAKHQSGLQFSSIDKPVYSKVMHNASHNKVMSLTFM